MDSKWLALASASVRGKSFRANRAGAGVGLPGRIHRPAAQAGRRT